MWCPHCKNDYPDGWKRCPTDETQLLRGPSIGKYQIEKLIGSGGMGAVYRAINPDTESAVALKLLHGSAAGVDAARARFQREAAAVAALKTRHVVSIFDFGADADGTLYLVMEHLLGHNLRQEVQPPPHGMPLPRVNLVFDGALRGLGAAHRAGIVHRDLKPENIFIAETDDGETPKLLDFGIARKGQGSSLTHSGALMGTPAYMAPEQVAGNRGSVGTWSDVYGMGVILYEMLSGTAPFAAESLTEVLSKVLSREFAPLRSVRAGLPEAVYQVCERALAENTVQRFPHADALREAWSAAFGAFPVDVRTATVPRFRPVGLETEHLATAPTSAVSASGTPGPRAEAPGPMTPATAGNRRSLPDSLPDSLADTQTPSAVVVSTGGGRRRGRGLALALGGVAAVAVAGVVVLVSSGGGDMPGPDAGTPVAIDAAVALPLDAGPPVVTVDAAGAPPGMARLPGGTFAMGTDAVTARDYPNAVSEQATEVRSFLIDTHEVTAVGLRDALGLPPRPGNLPDLPARNVTWTDADRACRALGKRLPTEAEWEFAARRGTLRPDGAHLKRPGHDGPSAVGSHPADCTDDGVCDLLGNVMEWTSDGTGATRVARGAAYGVSPGAQWFATIHARTPAPRDRPDPEIGFRCAADGAP